MTEKPYCHLSSYICQLFILSAWTTLSTATCWSAACTTWYTALRLIATMWRSFTTTTATFCFSFCLKAGCFLFCFVIYFFYFFVLRLLTLLQTLGNSGSDVV